MVMVGDEARTEKSESIESDVWGRDIALFCILLVVDRVVFIQQKNRFGFLPLPLYRQFQLEKLIRDIKKINNKKRS